MQAQGQQNRRQNNRFRGPQTLADYQEENGNLAPKFEVLCLRN